MVKAGGYTPKVTYRFTAGGREHTSDKLGYATRGYKNEVAARRLAAIPDEVEVWFDPENPTDAYIERHTPGIGWVMIVCGALGMVGALAWLTL